MSRYDAAVTVIVERSAGGEGGICSVVAVFNISCGGLAQCEPRPSLMSDREPCKSRFWG